MVYDSTHRVRNTIFVQINKKIYMTFLNELINAEIDIFLKEEFNDRLSLVIHKIKFMEKVPVICLGLNNQVQSSIHSLIEMAGGQLVADANEAKIVLYFEANYDIGNLLGKVASLIDPSWPAVVYKRVFLLSANFSSNNTANILTCFEDIAEMLHPGSFVYGNEGKEWVNFVA